MSRKYWLVTILILSIGLTGLFSLDAISNPARAETMQANSVLAEEVCTDWSSIPTVTTIFSDNPDPSKAGQSFSVAWFVRNKYFYPYIPAPNGNVIVSGGGSSCRSSSVTYGSCQLTISSPGSYVITARFYGGYYGMCRYQGSSDTEPHTVVK